MPQALRRWMAAAIAVLAFLLNPSCGGDSPTEPVSTGGRVSVGQTVRGAFGAANERRYSFVSADSMHAVSLIPVQGSVQSFVRDSLSQQVATASLFLASATTPPDRQWSNTFSLTPGKVYEVVLQRVASVPPDSFQLQVYRVNQAPEIAPVRFTFGDTVTGETIERPPDVDQFVVAGTAGQDFVAVAEALAAIGQLNLVILDSASQSPFRTVHAYSGFLATTGRQRLPETIDYRFSFSAPRLGSPAVYGRFYGPYRFWSYLINRAPEQVPATVPIGSALTTEKIDVPGDVDEFTLTGAAGAEFNVFIQAGRPFELLVPSAGATAEPGDTGLFRHGTGRFALPPTGPYTVRVEAPEHAAFADTGAYRVFVYPIDRRPEYAPIVLTPGDTVTGEAIDLPGDVDEFTFAGTAGDEFNVLFQAMNGVAATVLRLEVVDATGAELGVAHSNGTDTTLFLRSGGRFPLPASGSVKLRVRGFTDRDDRDVGPYRLVLYPIDRRPEVAPISLAFGDSVFSESLEVPGDVDEFQVAIPESSGANVLIQLLNPAPLGSLSATLLKGGQLVAQTTALSGGSYNLTGTLSLAPGMHTLRLDGGDGTSVLRTPYRVWMYGFRFGAEVANDTIAIGDTLSIESIDPLGDVDRYVFFGRLGQHVNIAFQGTGAAATGGLQLLMGQVAMQTPTRADSLGATQSARIDLPVTGWYGLRVGSGSSPTPSLGDLGPYRFAITELGSAPEQTAATLSLGDSVVTEQLDFNGDWDEYTLVAPPGQLVALVAHRPEDDHHPQLLVRDSVSGDTLFLDYLNRPELVRRFVFPATGRIKVAVLEAPTQGIRFC